MSEHTWKVEKGRLVLPSGNLMAASCHHRKGYACGGCYARLYVALDEVSKAPERAKDIIDALTRQMQAEVRDV